MKNNYTCQLKLYRGLPGSGKTTRSKEENLDFLHYESDHLFCDTSGKYRFDMQIYKDAKDFIYKIVDIALSRGESVALSGVFPLKKSTEEYELLAEFHNAEFNIITCIENFGSIHNVPLFVINKMTADFETF
jgi:hypothetical protein